MKKTQVIFVIIVTYNAMKWVDKCLNSLRLSLIPVQTVMIDNCSKDNTVSYIKANYPEVHIIQNDDNKGFGQANNQGIKFALQHGATHFFLLNQDAWVHPDTISKIVEIQDRVDAAIASPIHLNGAGDAMDFGFYNGAVTFGDKAFVDDLLLGRVKPFYQVSYVNAAAWMLSLRCVQDIGGFDPLFFHYGEDRNFCQRLQYHHEKLVIVPGAYIHHDREVHGNQELYDKQSTLNKLLITYSNINEPFLRICVARLKIHGKYLLQLIKSVFTLRFKTAWQILSGYCDFFGKLSEIKLSRKQNANRGSNWLNA